MQSRVGCVKYILNTSVISREPLFCSHKKCTKKEVSSVHSQCVHTVNEMSMARCILLQLYLFK